MAANRVRFEADDIGSAQKVWSTDNPGGRPVASGSELTATLYYINLPTNNSDFGLKFARVLLDGEVHDRKCFWAFYDADAYNYPGCGDLDEDPKTPPNYFHYYSQTAARYGSPLFAYMGYSHQRRPWETDYGCPPPYVYFVEVHNNRPTTQPIPSPGANAGQVLNYIDRFAWACRHEARHSENYIAWWGSQCYSQTNDVDVWPGHPTHGDAIPNWIEPTLPYYAGEPYNPTNALTFAGRFAGTPDSVPDYFDDDQLYTSLTAEVWEPLRNGPGESDPHDWAKPGNNWPQ